LSQGVQDIDGPSHVQALPEPARARRPRSKSKALRVVTRAERRDWITGHRRRRRHLRQRVTVRPPKLQLSVGPARDLEALLMHRAMMPGTEQREI
jgi:hypothetical protein